MKSRRKSRGFILFAAFVIVIIISGFALQAADFVDSPFEDIASTSQWLTGGDTEFDGRPAPSGEALNLTLPASDSDDDSEVDLTSLSSSGTQVDLASLSSTDTGFELPPISTGTDSALTSDSDFGGQREGQNGIAWSDIGSVLYNLWFISVTTAVFIVVQYVFKFSMKQIKRSLPTTAVAYQEQKSNGY